MEALGLPGSGLLRDEIDHSVASLALSRAGAAGAEGHDGRPPTLASFEQGVVDGHPYHPCCRSRPGFSVAEQLAFGPEHRPVVALDLVAVPAADSLVAGAWPDRFRDGDRLLLPVHPWQTQHILPALGLRPYAEAAVPTRALMSVRTVAPLDGGPHVKTALSMRMTSSVRDISARSVTDSAALSALLDELTRRLGGDTLRVTRNLGAAAAVVGGEPSPDLAALLRESPSGFADPASGETLLPVAALTGRPADGGPPLLHSLLEAAGPGAPPDSAAWLTAFARLALPAMLRLLSWGSPWRRTGRTSWSSSTGTPGRGGWSTATSPTSGSARPASRGAASPCPRSAAASATTPRSCTPSSTAPWSPPRSAASSPPSARPTGPPRHGCGPRYARRPTAPSTPSRRRRTPVPTARPCSPPPNSPSRRSP